MPREGRTTDGAASRGRRGGGLDVDGGQGLRGIGREGVGQRLDPKDPKGALAVDLSEIVTIRSILARESISQPACWRNRTRRPSRPWIPAA